ncbi:hypothetical protein ACFQ44_08910 [Levilactobacillus lanxiensis]|uniref:DNA-entry nuclease n=1 Tax=Levilactobacillus lanxiensis TaxID=2799568 RepID=A0ABW4D5G0_9LACO|nr:hypothetical protein [Levilactobacillus lanxiensis]
MTFALIWILLWGGAAYWVLRKPHRRRILGSAFIFLALFGGMVGLAADNPQPTIKTKTVQVGTKRLARAKAESRRLAVIASQQTATSDQLAAQASSQAAAASKAASASQASSQSESRASAKSASREAVSQAAAAKAASSSTTTQSSHARHTRGDLTTGKNGQIIGNKNSKIYHVPGQSGYHMNSSNAVYFQTEAQAKAAGYRKALR